MLQDSLTRRLAIRTAGNPAAARARVAVVATTASSAAAAAGEIAARLPRVECVPLTFPAYLGSLEAPAGVVLCVPRGPASRGGAFLRRAAARLLWPAPPRDLLDAIGGLRPAPASAIVSAPSGGPRSALLLEGVVDAARARAALSSVPRDWIVESVRHVRMPDRGLSSLARAGVTWSALEPVELVAVYAAAPLSAALVRRSGGLPPGAPVWIRKVPSARRG